MVQTIKNIIGKHNNHTIGILGSAPSLNDFKYKINSQCDIVIACNGALRTLDSQRHNIDYFLYGDRNSPNDIWYNDSTKFVNQEGKKCTRILPTFLLPFDEHVLREKSIRTRLLAQLFQFEKTNLNDLRSYNFFNPDLQGLSLSQGLLFDYCEFDLKNIHKKYGKLCMGGTITGVAAQIAFKMGASKINLYGCAFNNISGNNYAYNSKASFGGTSHKKQQTMDLILAKIQKNEVEINAHGPTNLQTPSIISE